MIAGMSSGAALLYDWCSWNATVRCTPAAVASRTAIDWWVHGMYTRGGVCV